MPYITEVEQYHYHFPEAGNMVQLQEHLRVFREAYPSIRCNVYDDHIVYTTGWGICIGAAKYANMLISDLNLPLVAVPSTHKGLANDTFIIKSIHSK
jgi:hypothetical protein